MLCWSHIPHCWKSHALAHLLWPSPSFIVEVTSVRTYSGKTNKLRNIYTIRGGNGKLTISKLNHLFIITLRITIPFVMDKSKTKKGASASKEFALLTEVQWDTSDLLFARNKDYQYYVSHLDLKL